MAANFSEVQELLQQRADYQARLKLMPYDGEDANVIRSFMKEQCWKKF